MAIEPLGVIQREARHREKKKKGEAEHREVRVQPAREMRESPLPMEVSCVLCWIARSAGRIRAEVIGQFCGSQGKPTLSLRRQEAETDWASR